jgi:hypothetical protein
MTIIATLVFRMCSKYGGAPLDALPCDKRDSIVLHVIRLVDVAKICKCALANEQVEVSIGDTFEPKGASQGPQIHVKARFKSYKLP